MTTGIKNRSWMLIAAGLALCLASGCGFMGRASSGGISDVVEDTSPVLGADLGLSTFGFDDANGNEQNVFVATASAINHIQTTNAAAGNGPSLLAVGDDTNVVLNLGGQGTGGVAVTVGENFAIGNNDLLLLDGIAGNDYIYSSGGQLKFYAAGANAFQVGSNGTYFETSAYVEQMAYYGMAATQTANFTVNANDPIWPVNTSGGAFTATLPNTPYNNASGMRVTISDLNGACNTNNLTVAPGTSDSILGAATSLKLTGSYGSVTLQALSASEWVIAGGQGYTATP